MNKVCEKCIKNCKQRTDCEIIFCPMYVKRKSKTEVKGLGEKERKEGEGRSSLFQQSRESKQGLVCGD